MRTIYIRTFAGGWKPLNTFLTGVMLLAEAVQEIEVLSNGKYTLGKDNITEVMVAKMLREIRYPVRFRTARASRAKA